jgi:hypothetical protein
MVISYLSFISYWHMERRMIDYVEVARQALVSMKAVADAPKTVDSSGAIHTDSHNIESQKQAELVRATEVLNRNGVRIMALDDGATIGVWGDVDGLEIRAALRTLEMDHLPVRYLESAGIPMRYKSDGRRRTGEGCA